MACGVFFITGFMWGWRLNDAPNTKVVIHKSLEQFVDSVSKMDNLKSYLESRLKDLQRALDNSQGDPSTHRHIEGMYDAYFDIYSEITRKK